MTIIERKWSRAALIGTFALFVLAAGCGEEPARSAPEIWCDGLCDRQVACDTLSESSHGTCANFCVQSRPGLALFSRAGAEFYADCLHGFECAALYDETGWDAGMDACWEDVAERVTPNERAKAFCRDYAAVLFECGSVFSAHDCGGSYGIWNDDVLDLLSRCFDDGCNDLIPCIDAVFMSL